MADKEGPLVSIITPSYNQGEFIEETIRSVLYQTYDRIEYIVMDGGSTDETVPILERYADRLTFVSEADRGQSDAINKGWQKSSGQILTWLNSDDLLATPTVVEEVVTAFERRPGADAVFGDFEVIGPDGEHLFTRKQAPFNRHVLHYCTNYLVPSAFFSRDWLDQVGYLDVELKWVMDLDYWLRALAAGGRFALVRRPMWKHRFHGASNTVGGRRAMEQEVREIRRRHYPSWLRALGSAGDRLATSYGVLMRVWHQIRKLTSRGWVDNLWHSYRTRRAQAESGSR